MDERPGRDTICFGELIGPCVFQGYVSVDYTFYWVLCVVNSGLGRIVVLVDSRF